MGMVQLWGTKTMEEDKWQNVEQAKQISFTEILVKERQGGKVWKRKLRGIGEVANESQRSDIIENQEWKGKNMQQ